MTTDNLANVTHNQGAAPIKVCDAGLVLLWPFLPFYFEKCDLMQGQQFVDAAARHRAVRLVHLLASGQWVQDETVLPLAKVMCGIDVSTPLIAADDAPTEFERYLSDSLLEVAIHNWRNLREGSIHTLREAFLMRGGSLTRHGASWRLDVERLAMVDTQLGTLSWLSNIVAFAWTPEPLHVQWQWR